MALSQSLGRSGRRVAGDFRQSACAVRQPAMVGVRVSRVGAAQPAGFTARGGDCRGLWSVASVAAGSAAGGTGGASAEAGTCAGGEANNTMYWFPAMVDAATATPVARRKAQGDGHRRLPGVQQRLDTDLLIGQLEVDAAAPVIAWRADYNQARLQSALAYQTRSFRSHRPGSARTATDRAGCA